MSANSKIVDLEQLFTPIKDYYDIETADSAKRYVDFRTAEELGAITHKRYEFPHYDLGEVDQLANHTDSYTNQPREEGILENPDLPPMPAANDPNIFYRVTRYFDRFDENGIPVMITEVIPCNPNNYIVKPKAGPNTPMMDFGEVTKEAESFYDLGLVSETIKGHWVEWTEWDRPKNWYPTNHVNVAVQVPADIDYATFMTEFKNTFYDIASAVLYIHSIIEVYVFGKENPWDTDDDTSGGGANFGLVKVPVYYSIEWAVTNDPARQDYRY